MFQILTNLCQYDYWQWLLYKLRNISNCTDLGFDRFTLLRHILSIFDIFLLNNLHIFICLFLLFNRLIYCLMMITYRNLNFVAELPVSPFFLYKLLLKFI
jgi:hypothetical protein